MNTEIVTESFEAYTRRYDRSGAPTLHLPRLLWINCRLLHPLVGGDRLRTFHMLRHLKRWFHVTYLCPRTSADEESASAAAGEYCDTLVAIPHLLPSRRGVSFPLQVLWNCAFGKLPFAARKYINCDTRRWLQANLNEAKFNLVVCDYLVSWVHLLQLGAPSSVPTVVFQHNVESLIWQRHAAACSNPLKRWIYRAEQRRTIELENSCAELARGQITVSPEETQHFRNQRKMKNVLGDVPAGVDCDYFTPASNPDPHTIAFLGSMDWQANVIAVRAFLQTSYPEIKRRFASARFLIIGRNPPSEFIEASQADPTIEVTGTVRDVRPYLAQASVMVLPLTIGGGTRIKVFEAMAAGVAIVSTPVGVEGLPVEPGSHAIIAQPGVEFTRALIDLVENPLKRSEIARTAREWVEASFSWLASAAEFRSLCEPLLGSQTLQNVIPNVENKPSPSNGNHEVQQARSCH